MCCIPGHTSKCNKLWNLLLRSVLLYSNCMCRCAQWGTMNLSMYKVCWKIKCSNLNQACSLLLAQVSSPIRVPNYYLAPNFVAVFLWWELYVSTHWITKAFKYIWIIDLGVKCTHFSTLAPWKFTQHSYRSWKHPSMWSMLFIQVYHAYCFNS